MFKTFFPDQRSIPIPGDYRSSLSFTQRSYGAIQATMGYLQRYPKRHRTLTRTWCDGPITWKTKRLHVIKVVRDKIPIPHTLKIYMSVLGLYCTFRLCVYGTDVKRRFQYAAENNDVISARGMYSGIRMLGFMQSCSIR
jgi:hypothetical protein